MAHVGFRFSLGNYWTSLVYPSDWSRCTASHATVSSPQFEAFRRCLTRLDKCTRLLHWHRFQHWLLSAVAICWHTSCPSTQPGADRLDCIYLNHILVSNQTPVFKNAGLTHIGTPWHRPSFPLVSCWQREESSWRPEARSCRGSPFCCRRVPGICRWAATADGKGKTHWVLPLQLVNLLYQTDHADVSGVSFMSTNVNRQTIGMGNSAL